MRHYLLYIIGLCTLAAFNVKAEGLPANPWIRGSVENLSISSPKIDNSGASAQSSEVVRQINIQLQDSQTELVEIINEALPEQKRSSSAINQKNLPSWQDLMRQIKIGDTAFSANALALPQQQKKVVKRKADSSHNTEVSRVISDIETQYKKIKKSSNSYYNQARRNIMQLEREAQNSVDELQRMIK